MAHRRILNVDQAKSIIVLKRSMAAGFSGVENDLFYHPPPLRHALRRREDQRADAHQQREGGLGATFLQVTEQGKPARSDPAGFS
ncbi:MAG TPA: NAD(P)(+) transhydrogenase (Re/Si-specific) subunit beta [Longimicrobium sp.]|nr:NAD(P)(+) transhydrogenase (Re/Si-specific) subunit beta [Longimicrobium sp.]